MDANEIFTCIRTILLKAIETMPREEWYKLFDEITANDEISIHAVESLADNFSTIAAEFGAYLGTRGANGCGDSGHDLALGSARLARRKVRQALGYARP